MLIGLATALKLTPCLPDLSLHHDLAPTVRRSSGVRSLHGATTTLLTVLPFLIIPRDSADFWFSALLDSDRGGSQHRDHPPVHPGMLLRLYLPDTVSSLLWLALVAVVAWYGFPLGAAPFGRDAGRGGADRADGRAAVPVADPSPAWVVVVSCAGGAGA